MTRLASPRSIACLVSLFVAALAVGACQEYAATRPINWPRIIGIGAFFVIVVIIVLGNMGASRRRGDDWPSSRGPRW